jgi:hypothetical protein
MPPSKKTITMSPRLLAAKKDYVRTIDTAISLALISLFFIWTLILGPVYNHYYPDNKIYYLILFQTMLFLTDIIALFTLTMVNRNNALKLPVSESAYNRSWSVLVSLITLYSIGIAVMLGGWVWRVVLYNRCLNELATDPCRTGANGNTALVMLIFDILNLIPIVGQLLTLGFSIRFAKVMRSLYNGKDDEKKKEQEEPDLLESDMSEARMGYQNSMNRFKPNFFEEPRHGRRNYE